MSCHFFCFSAFCFCWAGLLAFLAQASSALCSNQSNTTHTHTLEHRHTLGREPTSVVSVAATRRHHRLITKKRCSVAGTSRWHRHHTRCARFTPDMLKPRCVLRLYRPLGSAVAVPSMAFPDGNTYSVPAPFRNPSWPQQRFALGRTSTCIGRHLPCGKQGGLALQHLPAVPVCSVAMAPSFPTGPAPLRASGVPKC